METFINYLLTVGILIYDGAYWVYVNYPYTGLIVAVLFVIWLFKPKKKKLKSKVVVSNSLKKNKEFIKKYGDPAPLADENIVNTNGYTNSEEYKIVRNRFIKEMSKKDLIDLFEDIVNAKFKD